MEAAKIGPDFAMLQGTAHAPQPAHAQAVSQACLGTLSLKLIQSCVAWQTAVLMHSAVVAASAVQGFRIEGSGFRL